LVFNHEGDNEHADQEIVLCNPQVASKSKEREFGEEGCLSFPEIRASILRPLKVVIEGKDIDGKDLTLELSDWKARIFLHEFDHLDGILFIDRMTPADKAIAKPLLGDLEYEYRERANN
jgi:peptide deformylase